MMIIVPDEKLRKYLAFEDGKWIHDPEMPESLECEFQNFVSEYKGVNEEVVGGGIDNEKV